jgi:hypothetical protein
MNAVRVLIRLILSYVAAELGTSALLYLLNAPGLIHTWYPLIPLVLAFVIAFWALGYVPALKVKPRAPTRVRTQCSKCGGEIPLNAGTCPHCGMQFGSVAHDA